MKLKISFGGLFLAFSLLFSAVNARAQAGNETTAIAYTASYGVWSMGDMRGGILTLQRGVATDIDLSLQVRSTATDARHWGLTLGPVTGRLIADMMQGDAPFVDPSPYRPERFN